MKFLTKIVLSYFPEFKWIYTEGTFVMCFAYISIEHVFVHLAMSNSGFDFD